MNTIKFLQSFETDANKSIPATKFSKIRKELYSKGVCWTDSINGKFTENEHFRVVLYLKKNTQGIDFNNPIIAECNGLVLSYTNGEWSALAVPPVNCTKSKISMHQVDKFYKEGKYQIYEVLDATMITMYYYNNWRIATCKGFDVTEYEFINGQTYMDVFLNIAASKYPDFSLNHLDSKYSYTFALRSADFHKFNETKHEFLENSPEIIYQSNTYIKLMKVVQLDTLTEIDINWININLPSYQPIEVKNAHNIPILMNYSKSAYMKYSKGYETNNFKFKPLYGYILRTTSNMVPKAYKNIMISSSLYAIIKKGLYSNSYKDNNDMIVNMFIDQKRKSQFKVLFDQYLPEFNKLEAMVLNACEDAMSLIKNNTHISNDENIKKLSYKVLEYYQNDHDINQDNVMCRETIISLLYDFIHSLDYVEELTQLLAN